MENFEILKSLVNAMQIDAEKFFYKGNKQAGTRLRKAMQEVKLLANAVRGDVSVKKQQIKNEEK